MQYQNVFPVWKASPFLRLLPPFSAGIFVQLTYPLPYFTGWLLLFISAVAMIYFSVISLSRQFSVNWLNGVFIHILLFATGVLLLNYKDIRRQTTGAGLRYHSSDFVLVKVQEPLSGKDHSWKTVASVQAIIRGETVCYTRGKILLYFQKVSSQQPFQYGNQLIIKKVLQPVQASGNPGAFNYQHYCMLQGIVHQVYLKPGEYTAVKIKNENLFRKFLLSTEQKIIAVLKKYIPGHREAGLAEAMLIGYKGDVDKSLLQSYSNTGVVHIIAISGLHLGLIYWLLMRVCKLGLNRHLQPWLIIAGLWLFSCLAGGSASVLRSAVMFTCLVLGEYINRRSSVYNSLAASAFLLLCYNPFWLWDAGFQLSYAAVLSLAVFMKPIYNLLFCKNKIVDQIWKAMSVTLAAQLLTVPVAVYHFHQFPNVFLVANLVAVPLSGIILFGEIILCAVSMVPVLATGVGYVTYYLIYGLNGFIEYMDQLPFASWQGLQINLAQVVCLYIGILGSKRSVWWILLAALSFTIIRTLSFMEATQQKKLVVYSIPRKQAIDIFVGRRCYYMGEGLPQTRWLHRVKDTTALPNGSWLYKGVLFINNKIKTTQRTSSDIIILSNNAAIEIDWLVENFAWKQLVIDNSNTFSKVRKWKKDCARLGLPCHAVADKGAFVFNLY